MKKKFLFLLLICLVMITGLNNVFAENDSFNDVIIVNNLLTQQTGDVFKGESLIPYDYFVFGRSYSNTYGDGGANLQHTDAGFNNTNNGKQAFEKFYVPSDGTMNLLEAAKGNVWRQYENVGNMADGTSVSCKVSVIDGKANDFGTFGLKKASIGLLAYKYGSINKLEEDRSIAFTQIGVEWVKLRFEFMNADDHTPLNNIKLVTTFSDIDGNNGSCQGIEFLNGLQGLYYDPSCQLSWQQLNGHHLVYDTSKVNQQADDYSSETGRKYGFTAAINTGDSNYFEIISYFPADTGAVTYFNPQINNVFAGAVTVEKKVTSKLRTITEDPNSFTFNLSYTLPQDVAVETIPNYLNGNQKGDIVADGKPIQFTLKHGDKHTFQFPEGTKYVVTEKTDVRFNQTKTNDTGIINAHETSKALFVNEYKCYEITLKKEKGIKSVSGNGLYEYDGAATINAELMPGYSFSKWSGHEITDKSSFKVLNIRENRTYTASATPINYPIKYVLNGGILEKANPSSYTVESASFTLNNPVNKGYSFTGWSCSYDDKTMLTRTQKQGLTGEITYSAHWQPIQYSIKYNLNGGTNNSNNPTTYTIETPDVLLLDPLKNGYTFLGWKEGNSIPKGSTGDRLFTAEWKINNGILKVSKTVVRKNTDKEPFKFELSFKLPSHVETLSEINWKLNNEDQTPLTISNSTVSFNLAHGDSADFRLPIGTNYEIKETANDLYTLQATNAAGTISEQVSESNFVNAIKKYNLNLTFDKGFKNVSGSGEYEAGETAAIKAELKEGYRWGYWEGTARLASIESNVLMDNDKSFMAVSFLEEYPIEYVLNGGINDPANPDVYTIESEIILLDPVRNGYEFTGWTDDNKIPVGSKGPKTFTANWQPIKYPIIYLLEKDAVNNPDNPSEYYHGNGEIIIKYPTRPNYMFIEWQQGNRIKAGSTGEKVFTPIWKPLYGHINYFSNNASNESFNENVLLNEFVKVSEQRFINEGFEFLAWNTQSDGTGKTYTVNDEICLNDLKTEKLDLYAIWIPKTYTVKYIDGLNENIFNDESYKVNHGDNTPVFQGLLENEKYVFKGWDKDIATTVTSDVEYKAIWEEIKNYTITYIHNIENVPETVKTVPEGTIELLIDNLDHPEHVFLGWNEDKHLPGTSFTVNEDLVFVANWQKEKYCLTIRYLLEDQSEPTSVEKLSLHKGQQYSVESPVIDNYIAETNKIEGEMPSCDLIIDVVYNAINLNEANIPLTGDSNNILIYVALIIIAELIMAMSLVIYKKESKRRG